MYIADGVGEGDVTLDHCIVDGAFIVRGGGINSVHIINDTRIGPTYLNNVNSGVRLVTDGTSSVANVEVIGRQSIVVLEGNVDSADLRIPDIMYELRNTFIASLNVSAPGVQVAAGPGSNVTNANVSGAGVRMEGEGRVMNAVVAPGGAGTDISTPGTRVENNSGGTILAGGQEIPNGGTGGPTAPPTPGGGGGGGVSETPTPTPDPVASELTVDVYGATEKYGADLAIAASQ